MNKFNHMKKYGRSHTVVLNLNQTDIIINISDNISDGWKKQHEVRMIKDSDSTSCTCYCHSLDSYNEHDSNKAV